MHSSAQDGPLNIQNQTGEINYFPSEFSNEVRALRLRALRLRLHAVHHRFPAGVCEKPRHTLDS